MSEGLDGVAVSENSGGTPEVSGDVVPTESPTIGSRGVPAIAKRRLPVNGWVYFILGDRTGHFKIGWAKDVGKRLTELQTGNSDTLTVYGVLPAGDPPALERALHKRFAKYRIRGEWFDGLEEIAEFVDMYGYELEGTHRIWELGYRTPAPRLAPAYRF